MQENEAKKQRQRIKSSDKARETERETHLVQQSEPQD
jgi:hypothetical protein